MIDAIQIKSPAKIHVCHHAEDGKEEGERNEEHQVAAQEGREETEQVMPTVSSQRERLMHEKMHRSGKAKTPLAKAGRKMNGNCKKCAKRRS